MTRAERDGIEEINRLAKLSLHHLQLAAHYHNEANNASFHFTGDQGACITADCRAFEALHRRDAERIYYFAQGVIAGFKSCGLPAIPKKHDD